ncbi:hypothetical protein [Nitrospira sp. Nam74]
MSQKVQILDHSHAFTANPKDLSTYLKSKVEQLAIGNDCLGKEVKNIHGNDG